MRVIETPSHGAIGGCDLVFAMFEQAAVGFALMTSRFASGRIRLKVRMRSSANSAAAASRLIQSLDLRMVGVHWMGWMITG